MNQTTTNSYEATRNKRIGGNNIWAFNVKLSGLADRTDSSAWGWPSHFGHAALILRTSRIFLPGFYRFWEPSKRFWYDFYSYFRLFFFPSVSFTSFLWVLFYLCFILYIFLIFFFKKSPFWKISDISISFKFSKCSSFQKMFPFSCFVWNFKNCFFLKIHNF